MINCADFIRHENEKWPVTSVDTIAVEDIKW